MDDQAFGTLRRSAQAGRLASSLAYYLRRYPLGAAGAAIVLVIVLMAIFAGWITTFDPTATNSQASLARPGGAHPLGADFMGRDMWSRIVYGARISLAVGIGAAMLGCTIGMCIGLLSGYFGGWLDLIGQRFMDMLQALPLLVMALVMSAALGPSLQNTIIAISIPLIPTVARVIRSNTLMLREMPFVEAARGRNERASIAVRHVLPNTLAPLIVLATAQLGSAIRWKRRCRSSASAFRSLIRRGAECSRSPQRNTCVPRPGW
jgi:peptide/nickel transport system permease protein